MESNSTEYSKLSGFSLNIKQLYLGSTEGTELQVGHCHARSVAG